MSQQPSPNGSKEKKSKVPHQPLTLDPPEPAKPTPPPLIIEGSPSTVSGEPKISGTRRLSLVLEEFLRPRRGSGASKNSVGSRHGGGSTSNQKIYSGTGINGSLTSPIKKDPSSTLYEVNGPFSVEIVGNNDDISPIDDAMAGIPGSGGGGVDYGSGDKEVKTVKKKGWRRFVEILNLSKGLIFAVVASFIFSLSSYLARRLVYERHFDPSICLIARFVGTSILPIPILLYVELVQKKRVLAAALCPLCKGKKKRWLTLVKILLRGVTGSVTNCFLVYSVKYVTPGDVTVIIFSNPVFVALAAFLLLREKCSIFSIAIAILTILGVIIVCKPPFLTGDTSFDKSRMIGIGLAIGAMIFMTATIILLRLLKDVHYSIVTISIGFIGLTMSLTMAGVTGKLTGPPQNPPKDGGAITDHIMESDIVILFFVSILAFLGILCITLALSYEQAGPVSVIRASEVIFTFLLQMISSIWPDAYSLGGGCIVLLCILLMGFRQYIASMGEDRKCRKKFWFVLK